MTRTHDFGPFQFVRGERLGWLRSLSFSADGSGNLPCWRFVSHWSPPPLLPLQTPLQPGRRGDRTMSTHWGWFGAGYSLSWFKSAADSSGKVDDQLDQPLLLLTIQKDPQQPNWIEKGVFSLSSVLFLVPPSLHTIGRSDLHQLQHLFWLFEHSIASQFQPATAQPRILQ